MLRFILLFALFCALSCSKEPPPTATAGKSNSDSSSSLGVFIPDTALRTSIEQALGKSPSEMITQADMNNLWSLTAKDLEIKNLRGLETAKNLTYVNIDSNQVSDISSLSNLTDLQFLAFSDNQISDISSLSNLTDLHLLYFSNNQVSDISSLSNLTDLQFLYFFDNQVSDISSLSNLTDLQFLYFFDNQVSDISSLSNLTNLQSLSFHSNRVSDISSLSNLTDLQSLYFHNNRVSDISSLSNLTNLHLLYFSNNQVSDISSLSNLTNLQLLYFFDNQVSDISSLSNLTDLQLLYFFDNRVSDISSLSNLTNLQSLSFHSNRVFDISSLSNLTNLQSLYFHNNRVSDISSLSNLTNLQSLYFNSNRISDLTPLVNMSNLRHIYFSWNSVSDLSPLAELSYLEGLEAWANPLSKISIDKHIPALQSRGVYVYFSSFHPLAFAETESPFNIDLVFLGDFTEEEREICYHITNRWEAVIQTEFTDYTFSEAWSGTCGDQSINILGGEQIDDLRIYITKSNNDHSSGGPIALRSSSLPLLGCIGFAPNNSNSLQVLAEVGLHEIGHVLGIGTVWFYSEMLRELDGDAHFAGPQAIAAFDQAGGTYYQGAKVPTDPYRTHWHNSILSGELMASSGGNIALSAITLQALSDLGYSVDLSAADPYVLPPPTAAKPIADEIPFCSLEGLPAPVYVDD